MKIIIHVSTITPDAALYVLVIFYIPAARLFNQMTRRFAAFAVGEFNRFKRSSSNTFRF